MRRTACCKDLRGAVALSAGLHKLLCGEPIEEREGFRGYIATNKAEGALGVYLA